MARQAGFCDLEARLAGLSREGDELKRLTALVDVELFREELERAVPRADRSRGGWPPFDHALMFKVLILQTQNNLSDERTEFYLRDRLTGVRFLGLGLGDPVPDDDPSGDRSHPTLQGPRAASAWRGAIWTFREALTKAEVVEPLFRRFEEALREAGDLAMSGQLVDATAVSAPKPRHTKAEKRALKEGRIPEAWQANPAKLRQKDRHARWTVRYTKTKPDRHGAVPAVDIAIPTFGYPNHISADRRHRLIRTWRVTDAAARAGARLAERLDPAYTASGVWADTASLRRKNEAVLAQRMLESPSHRKTPKDAPMPVRPARANAKTSAVRAHIEHVFAEPKVRMRLFVRTIGLARAKTKIGFANLVTNMRRRLWLERQACLA